MFAAAGNRTGGRASALVIAGGPAAANRNAATIIGAGAHPAVNTGRAPIGWRKNRAGAGDRSSIAITGPDRIITIRVIWREVACRAAVSVSYDRPGVIATGVILRVIACRT